MTVVMLPCFSEKIKLRATNSETLNHYDATISIYGIGVITFRFRLSKQQQLRNYLHDISLEESSLRLTVSETKLTAI